MGNCHSVHEANARRPGKVLGRNFDRCQNERLISACDDEVEDFDFVQPTKKKPGLLKRLRNRFRKRETLVQTPVAPPCFTPLEDLGSPGDLTPSTDAECVTSQQPTRHVHTGAVDLKCDTILSKHDYVIPASYRNDSCTPYDIVPLDPFDDTPMPSEEVTPVPHDDVTHVPYDDVTPVPSKDVTPVSDEDVTLVPHEDVTPVSHDDATPTPSEDVTSVPHDDITPESYYDDVTPVPHDDAIPAPSEDDSPVPQDDVTPESYCDDVTPVPHDDATPAPSEDDSIDVYKDVAYGQYAPISNKDDARVPCQNEVGCSYRKGGTDASETDLRPSLKNDPAEERDPRNIIADHLKKGPPETTWPHREIELNRTETHKGPSKTAKKNVFTDLVGKFCRWKKKDPPVRVVTPRPALEQRPKVFLDAHRRFSGHIQARNNHKILTNILGNGASLHGVQNVGDRRRHNVLFGPELGGQRSSTPKAITQALYGHSPFPRDDGLSSYRQGNTGYRSFQNEGNTGYRSFQNEATRRGQYLEDRGRRAQANDENFKRIEDWSRRFQNVGLGRDHHDAIDKGRGHLRESARKGRYQEDASGRSHREPRDASDSRYEKVIDRDGHANQVNGCERSSPTPFDTRYHQRQLDSGYDPRHQSFCNRGGYVQQEGTDCRRLDGVGGSNVIGYKNCRVGFNKGSGYKNPEDDSFDRYEPFDDGGGHRKQVAERMQCYHEPFDDKDGRFKPPDDERGHFKAKDNGRRGNQRNGDCKRYDQRQNNEGDWNQNGNRRVHYSQMDYRNGLSCAGGRFMQTDGGGNRYRQTIRDCEDRSIHYRQTDDRRDRNDGSSGYGQIDDGRSRDDGSSHYWQIYGGRERDDRNSRYRQTDDVRNRDDGNSRYRQTDDGRNSDDGNIRYRQSDYGRDRDEGSSRYKQTNNLFNRRNDRDLYDNGGHRRQIEVGVSNCRQTEGRRGHDDGRNNTDGGGGRRKTVNCLGQDDKGSRSRQTYDGGGYRRQTVRVDGQDHGVHGSRHTYVDADGRCNQQGNDGDNHTAFGNADSQPDDEYLTDKNVSAKISNSINDNYENSQSAMQYPPVETKKYGSLEHMKLIKLQNQAKSRRLKQVQTKVAQTWQTPRRNYSYALSNENKEENDGHSYNASGGNNQHDKLGGVYCKNDTDSGYRQNDTGGGYHQNDNGGGYHQQINNGSRYLQQEVNIGDRHERYYDDTECLQRDESWVEQRNNSKVMTNRVHHDEKFQYETNSAMPYPPMETKKYGSLEHMHMIRLQNQTKDRRLKQVQTKVAQTWQTPRRNYSYSLANDSQISQNPDNNNFGTVSHNRSIQLNNSKLKRNIENAHSKTNTWNTNAAKLASATMRRPQGPPLSKGLPQGPFRRLEFNNKSSPWSRNTGNGAAQTISAKGNQTTVKKRTPIQAMTSSGLIYNTYTYV